MSVSDELKSATAESRRTTVRLTGNGPTIVMGIPEINGIPINTVRKMTLTCDPKASSMPLLLMELDVDIFEIELPADVQVIAHHYHRKPARFEIQRRWRVWRKTDY